jgi:hypothetical protein
VLEASSSSFVAPLGASGVRLIYHMGVFMLLAPVLLLLLLQFLPLALLLLLLMLNSRERNLETQCNLVSPLINPAVNASMTIRLLLFALQVSRTLGCRLLQHLARGLCCPDLLSQNGHAI